MRSPSDTLISRPPLHLVLALRQGEDSTTVRLGWACVCGLTLTLAQVLLICLLAGNVQPASAYRALSQWDSKWYARLAADGYPDTLPAEPVDMARVGFFPAYPLFTRLIGRLTGLAMPDATVLAAQLACWGFWTYILLFLQRWHATKWLAFGAAAAIAVHPCAFFLVTGYSESLFLLSVLGLLNWSGVRGCTGWTLAALHGCLMTATRIVGLPLALLPFLLAFAAMPAAERFSPRAWLRQLTAPAALSAVALLGGLAFFGFCQLQYGRWDAYMYSQHTGWGIEPNYLALFTTDVYRIAPPTFEDGLLNPNDLSRYCVPLTVFLFFVLVLCECRAARNGTDTGWRQRLGFYLAGGLMFYISVSGLANSYLISMIRYTFCVHVMLTLVVTHLLTRCPVRRGVLRKAALGLLVGAAILCVTLQIMCAYLFTHGKWVA